MLFRYPPSGVQNWGLDFSSELLRTKKLEVEEWDINQFLPVETYEWCQSFLKSISFSHCRLELRTEEERMSPLFHIYTQMRTAIQQHIQNEEYPLLGLLPSPSERNLDARVDLSAVRSVDLESDPNLD
jgi:hypothetical protein